MFICYFAVTKTFEEPRIALVIPLNDFFESVVRNKRKLQFSFFVSAIEKRCVVNEPHMNTKHVHLSFLQNKGFEKLRMNTKLVHPLFPQNKDFEEPRINNKCTTIQPKLFETPVHRQRMLCLHVCACGLLLSSRSAMLMLFCLRLTMVLRYLSFTDESTPSPRRTRAPRHEKALADALPNRHHAPSAARLPTKTRPPSVDSPRA